MIPKTPKERVGGRYPVNPTTVPLGQVLPLEGGGLHLGRMGQLDFTTCFNMTVEHESSAVIVLLQIILPKIWDSTAQPLSLLAPGLPGAAWGHHARQLLSRWAERQVVVTHDLESSARYR